MTAPERIVRACSGDVEAAELFWAQLERLRLLREEGRSGGALLPEQPCCPTCLHDLDEDGFCPSCGRLENNEPAAHESSGRARGGLEGA